MPKRITARILEKNIVENYKYLCSLLDGQCELMAVIKADAYGHGAARVASALLANGVKTFCVASLEEAIELRAAGIYCDVLILGHVYKQDVSVINDYGFIISAAGLEQLSELAEAAYNELRVHIKLDTGMTRNGIYCHSEQDIEAVVEECREIYNIPKVCVEGIYTHFSDAESDPGFTKQQFTLFNSVCNKLKAQGVNVGKRHCCNSAGILLYPEYHLDAVRAGIALYGYTPSPEIASDRLKKSMVLETKIDQIKNIKKGDTISYGRIYTAQSDMTVAVVSIGYGDGYPRKLSNKDKLLINGKYAPVVGRVCMDACMIDVSDIPCKRGDRVIVFGTDSKGADTIAELTDTISYEILCDIGKRVARVYE